MKKNAILLFLFLAFVSAVYAEAPFGLLSNVEDRTEASPARLLRKIAAGDGVCVQIQNELDEQENEPYLEMLYRGYNQWFSYAAQTIKLAGRQKEFADLMPLLERPVPVKEAGVDCSQPDLVLYIQPYEEVTGNCVSNALACLKISYDPMRLFFYPFKGVKAWLVGGNQNIISHELGHSLGMADQYKYGRNNAHEVYHTPDTEQSIMKGANPLSGFGCDDVDGLINLLDVGVFAKTRGGKDGWRSFCRTRNYSYVNGRPRVNAPYAVDFLSTKDDSVLLSIFDKKGNLISKKQYAFGEAQEPYDILLPFQAVHREKDRNGRIIYERNNRGEERFCSYTYERTSCIVVQGNKLLLKYLAGKQRRGKLAVLEYNYGPQGKTALISFNQRGRTGRIIFTRENEPFRYEVSKNGKLYSAEEMSIPAKRLALDASFGINLQQKVDSQRDKAIKEYIQEVYEQYFK